MKTSTSKGIDVPEQAPTPTATPACPHVARTSVAQAPEVKRHHRGLPLRVGTRGSPLALVQTRMFLRLLTEFCPVLRGMDVFQEHAIRTTGDVTQASGQRLADIGGKGLLAKEIHEALLDGRIDFAVHSLKDLETELPPRRGARLRAEARGRARRADPRP